ncbi:MAG: hypothetical protein Q4P14_00945 [Methanobacteriaceae archaeon]|nr:hypothetical protein [Methanobacteriaceae archaeon]
MVPYKYDLFDEKLINENTDLIFLEDNLPSSIRGMLHPINSTLRNKYLTKNYPDYGEFLIKEKVKFKDLCFKNSDKANEFLLKEVLSFLWIYPEFENIIKDVDLLLDWIHNQEKESNFNLDKFLEDEVYTFMLNKNRIKEAKKRVKKSKIKRKLKPFKLN